MKIRGLTFGTVAVLVMFFASSFVVYAQPIYPDLAISDISFAPGDDVHVGTSVTIDANIHNYGICWANLSDSGDYMGYNVSLDNTKWYKFNASIRWRAIHRMTGSIYIKFMFQDFVFQANFSWNLQADIDWRVDNTEEFPSVRIQPPETRDYTLRVIFLKLLAADGDLLIDWIELDIQEYDSQVDPTPTIINQFFEAETYITQGGTDINPDKRGVNEIVPSSVIVRFYDRDPDDSGIQIGSDQTVGDTNTLQDGTLVKYMKNVAVKPASAAWTADPPGYHDIYVVVDPDNAIVPEGDETNNKDFKTIGVYANLTIIAPSGWGGTTNPLPGEYKYYGTATVTALPDGGRDFRLWVIDEAPHYILTNPAYIDMDKDHTLRAVFTSPVGGFTIPVDKLALLAPYVAVAAAFIIVTVSAVYARKRWLGKAVV